VDPTPDSGLSGLLGWEFMDIFRVAFALMVIIIGTRLLLGFIGSK
jgi:hypothetical protein